MSDVHVHLIRRSRQRKWAWAPRGRDYSNDFEGSLERCNFWPLLILFPKSLHETHTETHGQTHTLTHLKVRAHILSTQTLMNLEHKLAWVNRCRITLKKQLNRSSPALPLAPSKPCKNSDPKPAPFLRSFYWRTATWVNIILHLANPHSTSIQYECINGKSIHLLLT